MIQTKADLPEYRERIGRFLRFIRTTRGIPLKHIAEATGNTISAVDRVERGCYAISEDMLAAYRDLIGEAESPMTTIKKSMQRKLQRARKAGLIA